MTLYPLQEITRDIDEELASHHPLVRRLLVNRGITQGDEAYRFLFPSYDEHGFDPFLLKDIDRAIERIYQAIQKKEKIIIYADYDCDGIPGAVVMHDFFGMLGYDNIHIYIPDRHKEGYGLQKSTLEFLFETEKPELIITVDLGITNHKELDFCKEQGVDVIVTDHHLPSGEKLSAYAVINPKQIGCTYPDPMLCGAGVAFKLVQAFITRFGDEFGILPGQEKWLLDMVGLATLSDMVPLVQENRLFAYYGMIVLKKTRRLGLLGLLKKAGVKPSLMTEDDVTFSISPRINASGRMDHPRHAFSLLTARNSKLADEKARLLEEYNTKRKDLVKNIMRSAEQKLAKRDIGSVIVIGDRSWAPGILGLVASRLVEKHKCSVFVWGAGEDEHVMKGSCRSDGLTHIVELMELCKDSFVSFGGHELAGGFSVSFDSLHFLEGVLKDAHEKIEKKVLEEEKVFRYDTELSLDDIHQETHDQISRLAPFGVGNPKPVFLFRDIVIKDLRGFGKHNEHLELIFESPLGKKIKAIAFFKTYQDFKEPIASGDTISLFASIEKSFFANRMEIRLRIEDVYCNSKK